MHSPVLLRLLISRMLFTSGHDLRCGHASCVHCVPRDTCHKTSSAESRPLRSDPSARSHAPPWDSEEAGIPIVHLDELSNCYTPPTRMRTSTQASGTSTSSVSTVKGTTAKKKKKHTQHRRKNTHATSPQKRDHTQEHTCNE
jgi:hypothetical protein